MQCPFCAGNETSVRDSRSLDAPLVRRKRLCASCGRSFATVERACFPKFYVLDGFGRKSEFDPSRLSAAMRSADKSRSISDELLYLIADAVAKSFVGLKKPVSKDELVDKAAALLFKENPLAGARFFCTHRSFASAGDMERLLAKLLKPVI